MLGVMAEPFKVDAIAGIDDAIYFALATVCLSMGIGIAVNNPNTGQIIFDLWNSFSGKVQEYFYNMSLQAGVAYSFVFEWVPEQWGNITTEIINFFNNYNSEFTESENWTICESLGSIGKLGFTADSCFSFELKGKTPVNQYNTVYLHNGSRLKLADVSNDVGMNTFPELYHIANSSNVVYHSSDCKNDCGIIIIENNDASFSFVGLMHSNYYTSYRFSPGIYTSRVSNNSNVLGFSTLNGGHTFSFFEDFVHSGFYDSENNFYRIEEINGRYCFDPIYDDSIQCYLNMEFDTRDYALEWFFTQVGLVVDFGGVTNSDNVGVYDPSIPSDGVSYDPDKTKQKLDELDGIIDSTGSLPMVIPGNAADL